MKDGEVDISGINKAELLAALFNGSQQQGMGFFQVAGAREMSVEQAREIIAKHPEPDRLYFDYLHGRVMKVGIGGDVLGTRLYDRDLGQGAAERVVARLRQQQAAA
jgi:hypothetical protein